MKKVLKITVITILILVVSCSTFVLGVNAYVKAVGSNKILATDEATKLEDADCIIIYGCFVNEDGTPCNILKDRLDKGIELYKKGAAPKIIMSGDHSSDDYNEVAAMKKYAQSKEKNLNLLFEYAEQLKVKKKILNYMEVLL